VTNGDAAARVRDLAGKLSELAERLGDPEVGDPEAAELAREAADLVSQAGNELDRALADQGSDEA
jgi:hypothetical protein